MTNEKSSVLTALSEELQYWEGQLATLSEDEITTSRLRNGWSIKDLMAHLMAWQQVTRARLEAASANEAPVFPEWLEGAGPESDEQLHEFNARIVERHRDRPWLEVHSDWRSGFSEVIRLGRDLPEDDVLNPGRFSWLDGNPLLAVLEGTLRHHRDEHRSYLEEWLDQRRS